MDLYIRRERTTATEPVSRRRHSVSRATRPESASHRRAEEFSSETETSCIEIKHHIRMIAGFPVTLSCVQEEFQVSVQ